MEYEKTKAQLIEETILRLEAEALLEKILSDIKKAKGENSVVLKEITYTVREQ